MDAYLVPAAAEFGEDIRAEHPGIAAGNIDVKIAQAEESVQGIVERVIPAIFYKRILYFRDVLDLVDQNVSPSSVLTPGFDVFVQLDRMAETGIRDVLQLYFYYVFFLRAFRQEILLEQSEEDV